MAVRIEYKASVQKDLRRLDRQAALRVLRLLERTLAAEGHRGEALAGEFAGLDKLRVGDHRVIYRLERTKETARRPTHEDERRLEERGDYARTKEGYLVLRIGHRREVYRTKPGTG